MQVAVIGYGYWGRNIAKTIVNSPFFSLRCIFDLDKEQVREARSLYEFEEFESYEAILACKEIEAVCIITPPHTHFNLALQALRHGKHVFVEKPLTTDRQEAFLLYEEARARGLALHCDHIFLYAPAVQWLKNNIHTLGNVVYINARRISLGLFQSAVDVVWDLAIHDLSVIDYLVGLEIKNIEVFKRKYQDYPHDAMANINLELESGIIVSISVSWLSPLKVREMIIGGEEKTAVFDDARAKKLEIFDSGVVVKDKLDSKSLYQKMVEYRLGSTHFVELEDKTLPLDGSLAAFASQIQNPIPKEQKKNEAHVLRIIEALERISAF